MTSQNSLVRKVTSPAFSNEGQKYNNTANVQLICNDDQKQVRTARMHFIAIYWNTEHEDVLSTPEEVPTPDATLGRIS